MLKTHMLFVGFSLVDDNFARIADAVYQVTPKNEKHGTALFLFSNAFEQGNSPLTLFIRPVTKVFFLVLVYSFLFFRFDVPNSDGFD